MSIFDLCEINEISQLLGLPFQKALSLYQTLEAVSPKPTVKDFMDLPVIVRRHNGCIGSLEVVI